MERVLDRFVSRSDCRRFSLHVAVVNVAAQHVYEKVGFKRVERIGGYYADGRDAYVMKKEGS